MSLKWLPNALTILRCILAFVVGWAILQMGAALDSMQTALDGFDQQLEESIRSTLTNQVGSISMPATFEKIEAWQAAFWPPFILFVLVAATDFLDGYTARKLNAVSAFGAFLDPVADKLLVAISLLALCYISDWYWVLLLPTIAIVGRDLFVTLIRLRPNISLPVSKLAKWKTAFEMIGIAGYLFCFALLELIRPFFHPDEFEETADWLEPMQGIILWASIALICIAAALSLYTGYLYLRAAFNKSQA